LEAQAGEQYPPCAPDASLTQYPAPAEPQSESWAQAWQSLLEPLPPELPPVVAAPPVVEVAVAVAPEQPEGGATQRLLESSQYQPP
jgi:hypothetical protein